MSDLPFWLRKRVFDSPDAVRTKELLAGLGVRTVCQEARCPNIRECYSMGTATFMILGDVCTRACRFCAIRKGAPSPPDPNEPERVAKAASEMQLKHVVITSVTRDDLPDGGAGHFAQTILATRGKLPGATVEVLTPDFNGNGERVSAVIAAGPSVFSCDVDTVARLYKEVRPEAGYKRTLRILAEVKAAGEKRGLKVYTKSGLMLGLGETDEEVLEVMEDLRDVGCDILTMGQYLAPSASHLPVARFVSPMQFTELQVKGMEIGFLSVAAGPFVRSSHRAKDLLERARRRDQRR